jgi:uncharacterized membrane protein YadS
VNFYFILIVCTICEAKFFVPAAKFFVPAAVCGGSAVCGSAAVSAVRQWAAAMRQ